MRETNKIYNENGFVKFVRVFLIIILLPFVIIHLIRNSVKRRQQKRENKEKIAVFNMSQIDSLSGEEFELVLKQIFEKLGYMVSITKKSHDYGVDLVITKNKNTTLVQAKCYGKTVGVKAVQEIVASRSHYGAFDAVVATNNYFSKDAEVLASDNNVKLLDRDVIFNLIKKYDIHINSNKTGLCATKLESVQEIEARYPYWI